MTSLKDVGSPNDAEASHVPADGHFRAAVSGDVPEMSFFPLQTDCLLETELFRCKYFQQCSVLHLQS
jgi:hypothetical protein